LRPTTVEAPAAGLADERGRERPGREPDLQDPPIVAVRAQHRGAARRFQEALAVGGVGFHPLALD
jgi:hypothetical protein